MPEEFCRLEPTFDSGFRFIELVKECQVQALDELLAADLQLRQNIDAHWFHFDSPAIVHAKHDLAIVDVLLKHGANVNERSSWWAGSFGVLDGVERDQFDALIKRGAIIGIYNAAEQGDLELLRSMLVADPQGADRPAGDGQRPLHVAATPAIAQLLLAHGADIEAVDVDHFARPAQYQVARPDVCRFLIAQGATPDIYMACALGDRELVNQVLAAEPDAIASRVGHCKHTIPKSGPAGGHIYSWTLHGATTPLEVARKFEHEDLFAHLYELSPPPQRFLAALWDGNETEAEKILADSPDVASQLDSASASEMCRAAFDGRLDAVKLMFKHGFDPHTTGVHDSTPLDRASFHGFREIVDFLLANDPNPPLTKRNEFGGTPLGTCIYGSIHSWAEHSDHLGTARALIEAGAKFGKDWIPTENPKMDELLKEYLSAP